MWSVVGRETGWRRESSRRFLPHDRAGRVVKRLGLPFVLLILVSRTFVTREKILETRRENFLGRPP
jgi:hypothetical protein